MKPLLARSPIPKRARACNSALLNACMFVFRGTIYCTSPQDHSLCFVDARRVSKSFCRQAGDMNHGNHFKLQRSYIGAPSPPHLVSEKTADLRCVCSFCRHSVDPQRPCRYAAPTPSVAGSAYQGIEDVLLFIMAFPVALPHWKRFGSEGDIHGGNSDGWCGGSDEK